MEKVEKSKNVKQYILMNVDFSIYRFLLREYHLFSQNTESSLEQYKLNLALLQKVYNSIATKLRVTLIDNYALFLKYF